MRAQGFKSLPGLLLCAGVLLLAHGSPAYTQTETSDAAEEIVVYGEREGGGGVDVISIPAWMYQGFVTAGLPEIPDWLFPGGPGGGDDTPEPDPCDQLAAEIADLQKELSDHVYAISDLNKAGGFYDATAGEWVKMGSDEFSATLAKIKTQRILIATRLKQKQKKYNEDCDSD